MAIQSKLRLNQMKYHVGEFPVEAAGIPAIAAPTDAQIVGSLEEHVALMSQAHQKRFGTAAVGANPLIDVTAGVLAHFNVADAVARTLVKNEAGEIAAEASTHVSMSAGADIKAVADVAFYAEAVAGDAEVKATAADLRLIGHNDVSASAEIGGMQLYAKQEVLGRADGYMDLSAAGLVSMSSDSSDIHVEAFTGKSKFLAAQNVELESFGGEIIGRADTNISMSAVNGGYELLATTGVLIDSAAAMTLEASNEMWLQDGSGAQKRYFLLDNNLNNEKLELKETEGDIIIDAAASGSFDAAELRLESKDSGEKMRFDVAPDRLAAAWSKDYVALSTNVATWTNYKAQFGEISLMDAIYQASLGGTTTAADYIIKVGGTIAAPTYTHSQFGNGTGLNGDPRLSTIDCYFLDQAELDQRLDVFVNGQKLTNGEDFTVTVTIDPVAQANTFVFSSWQLDLEPGDIVCIEVK